MVKKLIVLMILVMIGFLLPNHVFAWGERLKEASDLLGKDVMNNIGWKQWEDNYCIRENRPADKVDNILDGLYVGCKWQCIELSNRYYYQLFGYKFERTDSKGNKSYYADWGGPAEAFEKIEKGKFNNITDLHAYRSENGKQLPKPVKGDLVILKRHDENDGWGHASVVADVKDNKVTIVEQNFSADGKRELKINNDNVFDLFLDKNGIEDINRAQVLGLVTSDRNPNRPAPKPKPISNWLTSDYDGGHSRYVDNGPNIPLNPTPKWIKEYEPETGTSFEPLLYKNLIYQEVQNLIDINGRRERDETIYVHDRFNKELKWIYRSRDDNCIYLSGMAIANGVLLIHSNYCNNEGKKGVLHAFDAVSGKSLWGPKDWPMREDFDWRVYGAPPTSANGIFYVAKSTGTVPIDPLSGAEGEPYKVKSFFNSPVVDDASIYGFIIDSRTFAKMSLDSKSVVWSISQDQNSVVSPLGLWRVYGNNVYFSNNTSTISINNTNGEVSGKKPGEVFWKKPGIPLTAGPNSVVLTGAGGIGTYSYNPQTGEQKWFNNSSIYKSPIVMVDDKTIFVIYTVGIDFHLFALDSKTGEQKMDLNLPKGGSYESLIVADNWLYVGAGSRLAAFQ